jgi:hypothetical protein
METVVGETLGTLPKTLETPATGPAVTARW